MVGGGGGGRGAWAAVHEQSRVLSLKTCRVGSFRIVSNRKPETGSCFSFFILYVGRSFVNPNGIKTN